MKISDLYNLPSFRARCPEIKLGQNVCHLVNSGFPHYSMSKYDPFIEKHIKKTHKPQSIMPLKMKLSGERPVPDCPSYVYFRDLFDYIRKFHFFNCHESSLLAELVLKMNNIKNSYTASVYNGDAGIDHVVCIFNRDGSQYDGKVKNNQTIIVDPWAGICDFANNVFKEYEGFWSENFEIDKMYAVQGNGKYNFRNVKSMKISDEELDMLKNMGLNFNL